MWTIRRAVAADAPALAALAEHTFRGAFEADNTAEDMAAHVTRSYSPALQAAEIADRRVTTLVAEAAGALVAYAQLRRGTPPPCVNGPVPLELQRFYVAAPWHGRGLAQALMATALDEARAAGAGTVWLGVWERNARAIAFYRKAGFAEVGAQRFAVGSDLQRDLVMARPGG
jgi:ribosomal protein S18 acetylase RimI-like enzyme